jgi:hypothetical protein
MRSGGKESMSNFRLMQATANVSACCPTSVSSKASRRPILCQLSYQSVG